ncbi:WecB/TagA/CpsF family glycosyltransferase [Bacillus sp. FJAT-49732]|uniref:N-acetylglucosaminyldiphosphoundecaprenol N-acetyl-beta-D-mannosaminyltransferase n=1 Tax=Lederbergia citrisecunda TaxID=2833583 RepID=A0A942YKQ7_9BACI|nr:WecB/TagA/CpsF family glycosyltransferase [Lederbergia citrisecunda]MBS4200658.1 WecB/TagA/CpsF family glycosyltransferase [Lederbergia citrisecunda]
MKNKVNILGLDFDKTTKQDMINTLKHKIQHHKKTFIVTANPEIVMYALKDQEYMNTLQSADHIIADGAGIIMGSKLLKTPLPERVAGFDVLKDLLDVANEEALNVFFLGAGKKVIEQAVQNIKSEYPNLVIGGYHHGFFNEHDPSIGEMVKNSNSDIVFVALGFPKQEKWIAKNFDTFAKGIFMGVGGSFDILAGKVKRAPLLWRKLNLEWLYRLITQPARWKRMLVIPAFVKQIIETKK